MRPLAEQEVLVVDCQATSSGAAGHLLELSWARSSVGAPRARLIKLPAGVRVPPAVSRITGITDGLSAGGVEADEAWRELASDAAALTEQPAPTVAHFARFERPFLERLAGGAPPLDVVCTHEIAVRLFPELPRRSLRALAGYFGHQVGSLRRGAEHVSATLVVWRQLVALLDQQGVSTWPALEAWLAQKVDRRRRARHTSPMPRDLRLALPHRPGLYRMLRTSGDVLYVGKAASLHHRVNSYFRKQRGVHERTLEMLSQARGLSFEVTGSALEAALLEPDEIKRHQPPYNVALTERERAVWFCSPDLTMRATEARPGCAVGPFPSPELLDQLVAASRQQPAALGRGRWGPAQEVFDAGLAVFRARHPEVRTTLEVGALLRLGARLWREGRRARDELEESDEPSREWTAELVTQGLEWVAVRGALAVRRARWFMRMTDATLTFSDEGVEAARLLVIERGALTLQADAPRGSPPPVPVHHARTAASRLEGFSVARLDRLRVLTTELKRLVSTGRPVTLCLGPRASFSDTRLGRVLEWL